MTGNSDFDQTEESQMQETTTVLSDIYLFSNKSNVHVLFESSPVQILQPSANRGWGTVNCIDYMQLTLI